LPEESNTFRIEVFGCQMNQYDADLISRILITHGFQPVEKSSPETAQFIILQTCSVRQHAEDRILRRIEELSAFKKLNPEIKIIVSGCLAQHRQHQLIDAYPSVDLIVGPDQYQRLPELLSVSSATPLSHGIFADWSQDDEYEWIQADQCNRIGNAYIAIMRGCNNYCSYCIVPYLRGRERSRSPQAIIDEINGLDPRFFHEITLLGQNVNSYCHEAFDFTDLLKLINKETDFNRIRFITSHPKDLLPRLIEAMASIPSLCEYFHLPLQSGSNHILERMNRGYDRAHFINLITLLRQAVPHIALSTDVMVGFPGESDQDFSATLDLLNQAQFEDAYMYKYSIREGTQAAAWKETLSENEKIARLQHLIRHQLEITRERLNTRIGSSMEVLIEATSKKNSHQWLGRSRENLMVVFPKKQEEINRIVTLNITGVKGKTLQGEAGDGDEKN